MKKRKPGRPPLNPSRRRVCKKVYLDPGVARELEILAKRSSLTTGRVIDRMVRLLGVCVRESVAWLKKRRSKCQKN